MYKVFTAEMMRAADEYTIKELGISSEELMRRAGFAIAEEVASVADAEDCILVVCGTGNNGGDGYVCARELLSRGFKVKVYAFGGRLSPDCEREKNKFSGIYASTIEGDIIVDCIFGTGLSRPAEGVYADVINAINSSGAYVVSADIPSGLSGDSGLILGAAVRADKTVAVGELKAGFVLGSGYDMCGTVVRRDIGIVADVAAAQVYTDEDIALFYPSRPRNSHKGTFGTATLVCGSGNYIGAAIMSVAAALRSGCGYVKAVCPEEVRPAIASSCPQAVLQSGFDLTSSAIAFGMGCGVSEEVYGSLCTLLKDYGGTLIIDADGLNCLAEYGLKSLKTAVCSVILTPHVKEFSRISGHSMAQILQNPLGLSKEFASEYGVTLVLKGSGTIITDGARTAINTRGCSAQAKAGSGDMLSGYMCGSVARGLSPFDGAVCAAYTLGAAAELAAGELTEYCVTAADVLAKIPYAVKDIILSGSAF